VIIQAILIVAVLGVLFVTVRGSGTLYVAASKRIGLVLFAVGSVYAVLRPDDLTAVAHLLGVGRGTDLVLYALVVAFTAGMVSMYQRFRHVDRRFTELARTVAVREAEIVNRERGLHVRPAVSPGMSVRPEHDGVEEHGR
jgi:hypothetical protein